MALLVVASALAGAKLGLWWVLPAAPDVATLGRSGGVVQLGLVAGLAVAIAHIRWRRLPVVSTLDAVAPAVALGMAIGRLGGGEINARLSPEAGLSAGKGTPVHLNTAKVVLFDPESGERLRG